jgi:hypothetical protein
MLFMLNFWVRYQASEKQPPWAYRSLIIETDATMAPGCAGRRRLQAVRNGRNRHGSEASVVFRVFFFLFLFQCVLVFVIE